MAKRLLWTPCALLLTVLLSGCPTEDALPDGGGLGHEGDPCEKTEQCRPEYVCASNSTCLPRGELGTALLGDGCGTSTDCVAELICSSTRVCGKPGTGTDGTPCVGDESCQLGLICSSALACAEPGSVGARQQGEDCDEPSACA
ncbi:MAG: hypothetical protein JRH20_20930, partial [Deltaproteobacteria bacterium]|nr:hypothetical protein [Deltaproteobacteria bacterium]